MEEALLCDDRLRRWPQYLYDIVKINGGDADMQSKVKTEYVLRVRKLEKLCDLAFNDFLQGKLETLVGYDRAKKELISDITAEYGVLVVNNDKADNFIHQIYPKDKTKTGKLLDAIYKDADQEFLFNNGELNEQASEWFYSWTCGEDYVRNLIEIGKMILKIKVPQSLHDYVEEARKCFALNRYIAVCSLSRTIIEAFLLHLCKEIDEEPEKTEHGNPKMSSVFEIVSKGKKRQQKQTLESVW